MKSLKYIFGLLVAAIVLSACGHTTDTAGTATDQNGAVQIEDGDRPEDEMHEEGEEGMESDAAEMKVQLNASNFTFGKEEIVVEKGTKLTVMVTNDSGFHDFVIDELGVNSGIIPEGETVELEIPTDTVGSVEYYCSVGSHRAQGMVGTLTVEE